MVAFTEGLELPRARPDPLLDTCAPETVDETGKIGDSVVTKCCGRDDNCLSLVDCEAGATFGTSDAPFFCDAPFFGNSLFLGCATFDFEPTFASD